MVQPINNVFELSGCKKKANRSDCEDIAAQAAVVLALAKEVQGVIPIPD